MDISHISTFLQGRYKKIFEGGQRAQIAYEIVKRFLPTLDKKQFSIKENTIFLSISPTQKQEVFLKKQQLLKTLQIETNHSFLDIQ